MTNKNLTIKTLMLIDVLLMKQFFDKQELTSRLSKSKLSMLVKVKLMKELLMVTKKPNCFIIEFHFMPKFANNYALLKLKYGCNNGNWTNMESKYKQKKQAHH